MQATKLHTVGLTDRERGLMLAALDDYQPHEFITVPLHHLHLSMPRALLCDALAWLVRNKLTGTRLAQFIQFDCEGGYAELQRRLTASVLKDKETRLIAGKNFVV